MSSESQGTNCILQSQAGHHYTSWGHEVPMSPCSLGLLPLVTTRVTWDFEDVQTTRMVLSCLVLLSDLSSPYEFICNLHGH